jgi:LPXTG-motif cell wall-anchored protein
MAFARARGAVRFGAVLASTSISLFLGALPAHAGATYGFATVVQADKTVVPQDGSPTASQYQNLSEYAVNETEYAVKNLKLTIDGSSLVGVAELQLPSQCAFTDQAHLQAVCTLGTVAGYAISETDLAVRSAAGAAVGASGKLVLHYTADNATEDGQGGSADDTTTVTVGQGADLAVGRLAPMHVPAGASGATVQATVSNLGDQDAHGVDLLMGALGDGFAIAGNYSNCRYVDEADVLCSFPDVVIKPGETYEPATAVPVTAADNAVAGAVVYGYDTTDGQMVSHFPSGGKPGTGSPLKLVQVTGTAARSAQAADINYDNNIAAAPISTTKVYDLAAVGASVHGTVGKPFTATVGLRNVGTVPTTASGAQDGPQTVVGVGFPKGVKVGKAPSLCQDLGTPGGQAKVGAKALTRVRAALRPAVSLGQVYMCAVNQAVAPGKSALFTFSLTSPEQLKDAQGMVVAMSLGPDENPANDEAALDVTATAPAPAPSHTATPTTTAGPASASAAPSGGLAHTGGGSDALPLTAAGLAAVVLGAGAVLVTRRRRAGSHH